MRSLLQDTLLCGMPGKACSVAHKLCSRQLGTKHRCLYTQVPPRLQFPVETVVDSQKRLLGFTADGGHLLSYTSAAGYHLQVWIFHWGQPAELLADIDLFEGTSQDGSDSSDDDAFAASMSTSMAVSITETADRQLLIVHGCPESTDADEALSDAMNYITVIPHPCTHGHSLQGCHFKYSSIRGQLSQPLLAFIPPQTLMVHSSKGVQFLHLLLYAEPVRPDAPTEAVSYPAALHSEASMPLQMPATHSAAAYLEPGATRSSFDSRGAPLCHAVSSRPAEPQGNCHDFSNNALNAPGQSAQSSNPAEGEVQTDLQCSCLGLSPMASCTSHLMQHGRDAELLDTHSPGSQVAAQQACETASGEPSTHPCVALAAAEQTNLGLTGSQALHASETELNAAKPVLHSSPPARPAHSVWSMSASSESSSSLLSPSSSAAWSHGAMPTLSDDGGGAADLTQAMNQSACPDGLSHFFINVGAHTVLRQSGVTSSVTAELAGAAFDPERFIMDCLPHHELNDYRLTDYAIQQILVSDSGVRLSAQLVQCKDTEPPTALHPHLCSRDCHNGVQCLRDQPWAIILIVAVLKPRTYTHPDAVRPVTFTAKISPSGPAELLSEQWMNPEAFQSLVNSLQHSPLSGMDQQSDVQKLVIVTMTERHASRLRQQYSVPTSPHMRPVVLNNKAMLISGRSAGLLRHASLPICILGYGQQKPLCS